MARPYRPRLPRDEAVRTVRKAATALHPGSRAELAAWGHELPPLPDHLPGPGDVVVVAYLTSPLYLADNAVGVCADCRAAVQFRRYMLGTGAAIVCIDCAAQRVDRHAEGAR